LISWRETAHFVARGYLDRDHSVSVRVLSRDPTEPVCTPEPDHCQNASSAPCNCVGCCSDLRSPPPCAYSQARVRVLPGVTVDRYADFVVVQWYSTGALPWRDELLDAIAETIHPRGIYEQKRLRPLGGQAPADPATRARGDEAPLEVVVEEAGCLFAVDVTAPLGVGFFPDLRLGRDSVARRAAERRVLNLFSYTGAFSVRAGAGGRQRSSCGGHRGQGPCARATQLRTLRPRPGPHGAGHRRGQQDLERFCSRKTGVSTS